MADYAANFTNRYRTRYSVNGGTHTLTVRAGVAPGPYDAAVRTELVAFLDALADIRLSDWVVLDSAWSQAGTDFFVPAPPANPIAGVAVVSGRGLRPININFQGASVDGNRAGLFVYGVNFDPTQSGSGVETDYRLQRGDDSRIDDALDVMDAWSAITAIDGEHTLWHNYANININSYWQRKQRAG